MWNTELNPNMKTDQPKKVGSKNQWYKGSVEYWDAQPTTVDGVLGGYGNVHHADIGTSASMLETFKDNFTSFEAAIDCGAGIGRIAKAILLPRFR